MGKVSQLESMVKVLQDDLKKVSCGCSNMSAPHVESWSTCNILQITDEDRQSAKRLVFKC